jgi:hypothetical protein
MENLMILNKQKNLSIIHSDFNYMFFNLDLGIGQLICYNFVGVKLGDQSGTCLGDDYNHIVSGGNVHYLRKVTEVVDCTLIKTKKRSSR